MEFSSEIFEIPLDMVLGTLLWVSFLGTNGRKSDEVVQLDDAVAHVPVSPVHTELWPSVLLFLRSGWK